MHVQLARKSDSSKLWAEILEVLKTMLTAQSFEAWFSHTKAKSFENNILTVEAPDEFYIEQIKHRFADKIEAALKKLNLEIKVEFTAEGAEPPLDPEHTARKANLSPSLTFNNFAVGRSNDFAYRMAMFVANKPGKRFNPLFIWGKTGTGKTHLLHAIGNFAISKFKNCKVLYVTAEGFTNEMIRALKRNEMQGFKSKFRNLDILIIDDFQFLRGKSLIQLEMLYTIDTLVFSKRQIIIAADRPPQAMKWLDERLRSRLQGGLVAKISTPDLETKVKLIKIISEEFDLELSSEILELLARGLKVNNRELRGAIARLAAFASVYDDPLTPENVNYVLKDLLELGEIHVDDLLKCVSKTCRITVQEIIGSTRRPSAVFARQLAAYVMRKYMNMSLVEIGEVLNRKHSTVVHMLKKAESNLSNNQVFYEKLQSVLHELQIHRF